jgi:hypothetical protein
MEHYESQYFLNERISAIRSQLVHDFNHMFKRIVALEERIMRIEKQLASLEKK